MQILNYVVSESEYKPLEYKHGLWFLHWGAEKLPEEKIEESEYSENSEKTESSETSEPQPAMLSCRYCALRYRPSVERIRQIIEADINRQTVEKILMGYSWKNTPVYLSTENQLNYKTACDLAIQVEGANLPTTFKLSDGKYYTFTTVKELYEFYVSAVEHIQNCLQDGWKRKDAINYAEYADSAVSAEGTADNAE